MSAYVTKFQAAAAIAANSAQLANVIGRLDAPGTVQPIWRAAGRDALKEIREAVAYLEAAFAEPEAPVEEAA